MPDFYSNKGLLLDGWPATEFDNDALDNPLFGPWWKEITSLYFERRLIAHAKQGAEFLREKGCTSVAVVGFCWGGWAAEKVASTGSFSSASSIHGVHSDAKGYSAMARGCKDMTYHTV